MTEIDEVWTEIVPCLDCAGTGFVPVRQIDVDDVELGPCDACGGTGQIEKTWYRVDKLGFNADGAYYSESWEECK